MTAPTLSMSRFRTLLVFVASSRKPTPSSALIISMHDPNIATTSRAGGGARRESVMMDRTTTMRVKPYCSSRATHSPSSLLPLPCVVPCCESSALGALSLSLLSSFQTPDIRLCAAIVAHPGSKPGLHLELLRDTPWQTDALPLLSNFTPHPRPPHDASSYLDFSVIYIVYPESWSF